MSRIEDIKFKAIHFLETEDPKFRRTFESLFSESMLNDLIVNLPKQFELQVDGMYVADIFTALKNHEKAREYFTQIAKVESDKALLLHYANLKSGVFVYIEPNVEVVEPVILEDYCLGHRLLIVGEGAKVTFTDDPSGTLTATELHVGRGAKVEFVSAAMSNKTLIDTKMARVEAGANLKWNLANFSLEKAYTTVRSHLVGESANSDIYWTFYTRNKEQMDFFAGNKFDARNCTGEIICKGVGANQSKSSFVGEIDITLAGGGTDSYLKEEVLMLDETAKVDAIPSLEIKTNDVKAGHGVSISRLTEDRLFYLMSRGIKPEVARKLTLDGFLKSVYSGFSVPSVVEKISEHLDKNHA